jgi:hypothetical protein|tara:strand:- start:480 stop:614 length:135 start_codon:yes stop_codon:yes gene_type:complete
MACCAFIAGIFATMLAAFRRLTGYQPQNNALEWCLEKTETDEEI